MKPGRELDALVAEKVMGLPSVRYQPQGHDVDLVYGFNVFAGVASMVPCYSIDIAAVWQVVKKLNTEYECVAIITLPKTLRGPHYICNLEEPSRGVSITEYGDNPAHAICLAALKACGVKV